MRIEALKQKLQTMNKVIYIVLLTLVVIVMQAFVSNKGKAPKTKAELGKLLFFDTILSRDNSISCASCHKPEFAFADTMAFSRGINNQFTGRNTPTAMNLLDHAPLFYDGRAADLKEQALGPITNPGEMGLSIEEALLRLNSSEKYAAYFQNLFQSKVTKENLGEAIAEFENTLETSNTPFDRSSTGKKNGMNESAVRGRSIFLKKGKCFDCHRGPDFSQDDFRNIGLYNDKNLKDKGRFDFTKKVTDIGKFKVPGLRNVAVTAPYMHNGMFKTLREVIDYYDNPQNTVPDAIGKDSLLAEPLNLSEQEKQDLEAFLNALTDDRFLKKK